MARPVFFLPVALGCLALAGCRTTAPMLPPAPANAILPVVAVTDFRNESGFSGQWHLGRGIPDLLVAELLETRRVVVVERRELDSVLGEIMRQGREFFRKEESVDRGRLKNARYLVRGVITDFTQTRSATGWFRSPEVAAGGRGARAVVMVHLTVTDVETGEILCSIPAEGTARASSRWVRFDYNKTSFGGEMFFRSPVGRATREALRKAVAGIVRHIPYAEWEARVADAIADAAVVNGGENVNVREGDVFDVREPKRPITDPVTGDVIDWARGKIVGRIRVTRVGPASSDAIVISGEARRGYHLEKAW